MNDEVKEILNGDYRTTYYEVILQKEQWNKLLDYITNLQKEKIELVKQKDNYKSKVENTLGIAFEYGQIDGSHHRVWCIDQMVRELADDYGNFIKEYEEDGEYTWDIGIAP